MELKTHGIRGKGPAKSVSLKGSQGALAER